MNKNEIEHLYRKKIRPRIFSAALLGITCLIVAFLFIFIGQELESQKYSSYCKPKFDYQFETRLPIAPTLAQDLGPYYTPEGYQTPTIKPSIPNPTESQTSPLNEKDQQLFQEKLIRTYALPFTIKDSSLIYHLFLQIDSFPLRNNFSAGLAIEVYDEKKTYLFTFYTNDFYHESGTDDEGLWEEKLLSSGISFELPAPGTYYLYAGVPPQTNQEEQFKVFQDFSKGSIAVKLTSKKSLYTPMSQDDFFMPFFFIFLFLGLILYKFARRTGFNIKHLFFKEPDFKQYDYILEKKQIEKNGKKTKRIFLVSGLIKNSNKRNSFELILNDGSETFFWEIEREVEEGITYYYHYLYREISPSPFSVVPSEDTLTYEKLLFKKETQEPKSYHLNYFYSNGLTEKRHTCELVYGTRDEKNYLCFEYDTDPSDFTVSLGKTFKNFKLWRVKK